MIYLSTGGEKVAYSKLLRQWADSGIRNIELSAGIYSSNLLEILKQAKIHHSLNFVLHNYFPPPEKPFVLNLASPNPEIRRIVLDHCRKALEWCEELESPYYGVHAGFLIDPEVNELGKRISNRPLNERSLCLKIFSENIEELSILAKSKGVQLLIENNVLSERNFNEFKTNPLLLVEADEIIDFFKNGHQNVKLLLDVAHLKVSAKTLNFNAYDFLSITENLVGGYHLSDNDGTSDSNEEITTNSWFLSHLKKDIEYITIEVYNKTAIDLIHQSQIIKRN